MEIKLNQTLTLTGNIKANIWHNEKNGYSIFACEDKNKEKFTVLGSLPLLKLENSYLFTGEWKFNKDYGYQFHARTYKEAPITSLEGIKKFLEKQIDFIGPVNAKKIVDKFGIKTYDILTDHPERLQEINGIGKIKMKQIKKSWDEKNKDDIADLYHFFYDHNIPNTSCIPKIYKKYGEESVNKIKENPYILCDEVSGIGFQTADAIAMQLNYDKNSANRLRSGLLYILHKREQSGHCFEEWMALGFAADKLLECNRKAFYETAAKMASEKEIIVEDKVINREKKKLVYLPELYNAEVKTAFLLRRLMSTKSTLPEDFDFSLLEENNIELDPVQLKAVQTALKSKIFILTGGPGTGKTTTMQGIIRMLKSKDIPFLLAAPTGRAAKRLSEATNTEGAKTIHRLLEFSNENDCFMRNEDNPLEGKVLIIDECSMIGIHLMYSLLRAIPMHMTLIMVGDVDQLPSVEAGNVLRDIINSRMFPVTKLTKIFRQAQKSKIITNAHLVNSGHKPDVSNSPGSDFYYVYAEDNDVAEKVLSLVKDKLPQRLGISPYDIQVLSPNKNGEGGTINLNKVLQKALNPYAPNLSIESDGKETETYKFLPFDKVMQTRNNYKKGVFNGDVGRVVEVNDKSKTITVNYDGSYVDYGFDEQDELILAYASTVHKSQGSEYPVVVMIMLKKQFLMQQRNLLYTGITRAKKLFYIVGDDSALEKAAENDSALKRNTMLTQRLTAPMPLLSSRPGND